MAQFKCEECDQGFEEKSDLEHHVKTSHPHAGSGAAKHRQSAKADTASQSQRRVSPVHIAALFKGAGFPMSGDQLKAFVRDKHPDRETLAIIEHFSDKRTYENMADVEREAGRHL